VSFLRQQTNRVVRATLPVDILEISPKTQCYAQATPQIPFRLLELWTHSPGSDLLVQDIKVGNISLFTAWGSVPAETWDIVAITRAVEVAIQGGWKPEPGKRHPLYDRLLIHPETANVGTRIALLVENPTDRPLKFRASLHGVAIDSGGGYYGDMLVHEDFGEPPVYRFDDLVPSAPKPAQPPVELAPTEPPKALGPAPRPDPLGAACRTCGAIPGQPCIATGKGKTHPARGLRPGECSACPRAAWAGGLRSKCNFCGKEGP